MTDTLSEIQSLQLAIRPGESSADDFAELRTRIKFVMEQCREWLKQWDDSALEDIRARGADLVIGDERFYEGIKRTTKSIDNAKTLWAMMEVELKRQDGDLEQACKQVALQYLASQPWRYAECRENLPHAMFEMLFEITEEPDLKTGKPKKQLLSVNEKFLKRKG